MNYQPLELDFNTSDTNIPPPIGMFDIQPVAQHLIVEVTPPPREQEITIADVPAEQQPQLIKEIQPEQQLQQAPINELVGRRSLPRKKQPIADRPQTENFTDVFGHGTFIHFTKTQLLTIVDRRAEYVTPNPKNFLYVFSEET